MLQYFYAFQNDHHSKIQVCHYGKILHSIDYIPHTVHFIPVYLFLSASFCSLYLKFWFCFVVVCCLLFLFVDLFSSLDSTCKWNHTVFFLLWLILLSLKLFTSLWIVANGKMSFFLWLSNIPVGMCISHLLYPFTDPWKWRCFCILARVIKL